MIRSLLLLVVALNVAGWQYTYSLHDYEYTYIYMCDTRTPVYKDAQMHIHTHVHMIYIYRNKRVLMYVYTKRSLSKCSGIRMGTHFILLLLLDTGISFARL